MGKKDVESAEARKFKEAILIEIFNAYQASGLVYQKTTDLETRQSMLDMKRCYDLAINHLAPLGVHAEKHWEDLGARFSA